MKIETSMVAKVLITDAPGFGSVSVFLENLVQRQGKITFSFTGCYPRKFKLTERIFKWQAKKTLKKKTAITVQ